MIRHQGVSGTFVTLVASLCKSDHPCLGTRWEWVRDQGGLLCSISKREQPMSNQHSVTKRHRRPKSDERVDFTAQTMAALKQLSQAATVSESKSSSPQK